MSEKKIHIVSFDNPYPPNYGGVIDVFYKIKALHAIGYKIHLHCFTKQIPSDCEVLQSLCSEVFFYEINQNPFYLLCKRPFSVLSRSDAKLVENILKTDAPILFDGLKTTFVRNDVRLKNYKKFLRLHNIEHNYYKGIAVSETIFLKKIAFYFESWKYKYYEQEIGKFDNVFTLSEHENDYTQRKFSNAAYIPVFHGNETVKQLDGFGKFAFYHGDLTTSDNRKVVLFLIEVFKQIPDYQLVIASGTNRGFVNNAIQDVPNIKFVELSGFEQLLQLFEEAHLNICWSFQKSGTKLKLINALFNSRFCIINENIIDDKKVADLCVLVNNKEALIAAIKNVIQTPFTESEHRKKILESHLNDIENAKKLAAILSEES